MAKQTAKLLKVTFNANGFEVVETFDLTPHANGFVPDYKLRAMALGWSVRKVEEVTR